MESECFMNKQNEFSKYIGKDVKIKVNYFCGWDFSNPKCIQTSKVINGTILLNTYDNLGFIIYLKNPEFFSWGNGITIPSNMFALLLDNTMGYYYKNPTNYIKWSDKVPTWEFIEEPTCLLYN
jgi:hypothetical protein